VSTNPFVLDKKEYKRNLDIVGSYLKDTSTYLHLMSGKPLDVCTDFVKTQLRPGGMYEFKDPRVLYHERDIVTGDKSRKETTLLKYINDSIKQEDLIAPTFTTYLNPKIKTSPLVDFIDTNVKLRGVAKKAMFKAKMEGNVLLEAIKKNEQTSKKLNNNAMSGAHVSASTPLYNKTAHSTLTSTCRTTSGYGNANNEKFTCGNRHYWSPDIVRNNIISIINNTNYELLDKAINTYGLHLPSIDEVCALIKYSTDLYWSGNDEHLKIRTLVSKLTDIQRAAFAYTGDFYHLMKFNDLVIHKFVDKLSSKITTNVDNPEDIINTAPDDYKHLAAQICAKELMSAITSDKQKTTNIKDLDGKPDNVVFAATIKNIEDTLSEYALLIKALWVTPNLPASLAVLPDSIRRAAITSDTDSTIFTVQNWVIWHQGKLGFDDKSNSVAAVIVFLAAQTITHVLAIMSANFGIEEKRLNQIAMKNEFMFPVFVPTSVGKHYYALIGVQEGNIFKKFGTEIKGVHLKSSNAPKEITKEAENMMLFIMNSVVECKKISIHHILKWIADVERKVIASIKNGNHEYFRVGQIKPPGSYKNGESTAAYQQYVLWQDVFAPKYGMSAPPPYTSIKINVDIDTPVKTSKWLSTMLDRDLADRLQAYLDKNDKKCFGSSMMLPEQILSSKGIPIEITDAINIRMIVLDTVNIFYLILDSLGINMLNSNTTKLCSDIY
jgi:hypothetical protein